MKIVLLNFILLISVSTFAGKEIEGKDSKNGSGGTPEPYEASYEGSETATTKISNDLSKYTFDEAAYEKASNKEEYCKAHINNMEKNIKNYKSQLKWDPNADGTERNENGEVIGQTDGIKGDCVCTNGGSRGISCEDQEIEKYVSSYLQGDSNVEGNGNQCLDTDSFNDPNSKFQITRDSGGEFQVKCTANEMYFKQPMITQDEIVFIKKEGAGQVTIAQINDDTYGSCKKIWGSQKYAGDGITAPTGNYICALAETNAYCSHWTTLYKTMNDLGNEKYQEVLEALIGLQLKNGGGSREIIPNFGGDNVKETEIKSLAILEEQLNGGREAVLKVKVGDDDIKIKLCPKTLHIMRQGSSPSEQAANCRNEILQTLMGSNADNTIDASMQDGMIVYQQANILEGAAAFNTLNRCRNQVAAKIVESNVVPCRAFQAVAHNFTKFKNEEEKYSTYDQRISCRKDDMFTADFKFCKRLVDTYNAAAVSENVGKMAEQVSMGDANIKATNLMAENPEDVQDASLQGAKLITQRKITHEWSKVGLYTTHAAIFGGFLASWPTPKNLGKKCESESGTVGRACCTYASAKFFPRIFKNYEMKRMFAHQLFYALGKAGAAGIMATLYKKQKDQLTKAQDELAELEPEEYSGLNQDMLTNLCQADPRAPGCQTGRNIVNNQAVGQGNINFNGNTGAQMGAPISGDIVLDTLSDGTKPNLSEEDKAAISESIAGNTKSSGGFETNVGAAQKTAKEGGGGGGGGGGGASASAPGLSGAAKSDADPEQKMITSSGDTIGAGKNSGFSYGASGYSFKKGSKAESNPFNSLFGKKGGGGGVTVRGVASDEIGDKKYGIFDTISKRYNTVKEQKRLMEYETE